MKNLILPLITLLVFLTVSIGYAQYTKPKKPIEKKKPGLTNITHFDVPIEGTPMLIKQEEGSFSFARDDKRYGVIPSLDFRMNADNTMDVLWIDDETRIAHITRVSLESKNIVENIPIPNVVTERFLGFETFDDGKKFIIGYAKKNSFKQESEAWYSAFTKDGTVLFSTRIWGDVNLDAIGSKGEPGRAGSSMIRYNKSNNTLGIYLSHTMKWNDNVRHQAGWVGFLDATTGALKKVGNDWFYSHNFDQRLMVTSAGEFYTLAHGDAYQRALAIHRWADERVQGSLQYFQIPGEAGDNITNTTTGDFAELSNGNVAIAYSTAIDRESYDLRVAIVSGMTSTPAIASENWITSYNSDQMVDKGTKVIQYSENEILVGWNVFSTGRIYKETYLALLDLTGKLISEPVKIDAPLYPSQSFQKTTDGKIVIISAAQNKLTIHTIPAP